MEGVFEERPTKLEIPNSSPLGGDMDGMGDLDNAPMPPMGADDPMGGMPDDMGGEPPMDDPNAMGNEPPMDDPNAMGGEDDELMSIINGLSIEDKAAVTKYAKSMADDNGAGMPQDETNDMPMESRVGIKTIIDEVINDVLDDKEGIKRPEKKLPKEYTMETPFKSPYA